MRVVVTGASGFVAGHLIETLDGTCEVIGVSRRAPRRAGVLQVEDYVATPPGDVLVHLAETNNRAAAEREGAPSIARPLEVLDRLLARGFGAVVYASSAAVYGDQSTAPHGIDDPVEGRDVYTAAKLACEARVLAAGGAVARLSNLYGPAMSADTVLAAILSQLHREGPVRVIDDGPVRDFLWAGDAALALRAMVERGARGVFNVGSGVGTSVRELARLALACAGEAHRDVVATRPSAGRASCCILDVAMTTRELGWRPQVALAAGLDRLVRSMPAQPA